VGWGVPVATPFAFGVPTGCVRVVPVVGVAANTTVAPWIGFPLASFAVTVMVDVPLPAVIGEVAATVDCVSDTVPAFTTTVAVCVMATELMLAETVCDPPAVDERLPVATPLTSVAATGCVTVLPLVGLAARTTVAPWIGLPLASLGVTERVVVTLPAVIGAGAATAGGAAATAPDLPP